MNNTIVTMRGREKSPAGSAMVKEKKVKAVCWRVGEQSGKEEKREQDWAQEADCSEDVQVYGGPAVDNIGKAKTRIKNRITILAIFSGQSVG